MTMNVMRSQPAPQRRALPCDPDVNVTDPLLVENAKREYELAERRCSLLGEHFFSDPAWNMLLDLFISGAAGRRLSVSSLCIGSRSSHATALRYETLLRQAGLVERSADDKDGRRTYVSLTASGWSAMAALLGQTSPVYSIDPSAQPTKI